MIHQDRVHALRQTHSTVSTLMPLITAGLTVAGALIAAIETRNASGAASERDDHREADAQGGAAPEGAGAPAPRRSSRPSRPGSIRRYISTLAGRLLLVLLGAALVLAITFAATSTGRIGEAITITALVLLTLYLVEKAARQA